MRERAVRISPEMDDNVWLLTCALMGGSPLAQLSDAYSKVSAKGSLSIRKPILQATVCLTTLLAREWVSSLHMLARALPGVERPTAIGALACIQSLAKSASALDTSSKGLQNISFIGVVSRAITWFLSIALVHLQGESLDLFPTYKFESDY